MRKTIKDEWLDVDARTMVTQNFHDARIKIERYTASFALKYALPELVTRSKQELDRFEIQLNQDLDLMDCQLEQKLERCDAEVLNQDVGAGPSSKRQLGGAEMMPEDGLKTGRDANRKQRGANDSATAVNPALAANNVSRRRPKLGDLPAVILTVAHEQPPPDYFRTTHHHQPRHSQPQTQSRQTPDASWETKTQSLRSARDVVEIQPEGGYPELPLGPGQTWSGPIKENQMTVPGNRFVVPAGEVRSREGHFPSIGEPIHPGFKVMQPGCDECTRRNKICTFGVGTNHRGRERDPTKGNCDLCFALARKCRGLGFLGRPSIPKSPPSQTPK